MILSILISLALLNRARWWRAQPVLLSVGDMVDVNFTSCKVLDATITIDLSLVDLLRSASCVFFFYVGDAGNTSLVEARTPLGATAVVTPGSAGYPLWECCILASL